MRITAASPILLVSLCLVVACSDNKDPLDGLTALPDTGDMTAASTDGGTGGEAGTHSMSGTGNASDSGASNSGASDTATSTGDPPATTSETATVTATSPTSSGPTGDPSTVTSTSTGDPGDPYEQARQLCVDLINMYRGTLGLPPYQRWTDAESCSDAEAAADGQSGTPHGAFGQCGESAQNECPGWSSPAERSLPGCLEQMWAEGPGEDFNMHGHYINMSSEQYSRVACGFADAGGGEMWMVQNFQ